jgi:hypothetical protein
VHFRFYRLRFWFIAAQDVHFPAGKAGNTLRGAFGTILRKLACDPSCTDARTCARRATCAYARTFEPAAAGGPSGLHDWPRPFVFRASQLDGATIRAGVEFHCDVHLFQLREPAIPYFRLTFAQFAREGLGAARTPVELVRMEQLDAHGNCTEEPAALCLEPGERPVNRVVVRFVTPTELKHEHRLVERPEFGVVLARVRDRVSTLASLYGDGPLGIDFAEFGRRASTIEMTRYEARGVSVARLSSRTGQRHPIGGFVGEAEYSGQVAEFVPFLKAAQFTGVGRQTTWGKGELAVVSLSYAEPKWSSTADHERQLF